VLRVIFKTVSFICFAVALISGVLDLTRSIADRAVIMTPLMADWIRFSPDTLVTTRELIVKHVHPFLWTPVMENILRAPTWAVFAILAILFAMGARNRRRRWQESFGA